jgi:hypothetical protein
MAKDDILKSPEINVIQYDKNSTPESKETYDKFNSDFGLYLSKLPSNNVKKYVTEIAGRDLIYLGHNQISKDVGINFASVVVDDNRLKKIILDAKEFGINFGDYQTCDIDGCVYATYFAFIRAAVLLNSIEIKNNKKLQELLAQYLFQIFISVVDTSSMDTVKQKFYFKMMSYYTFYRHYMRETSAGTLRILRNIFKDERELIEEFLPYYKQIDKYSSVKDFPKILLDTKIMQISPNIFQINFLKKFKQHAFYCVYGSLDMYIAFSIITVYPFDIFNNVPTINNSIQKDIEKIMVTYLRKVNF